MGTQSPTNATTPPARFVGSSILVSMIGLYDKTFAAFVTCAVRDRIGFSNWIPSHVLQLCLRAALFGSSAAIMPLWLILWLLVWSNWRAPFICTIVVVRLLLQRRTPSIRLHYRSDGLARISVRTSLIPKSYGKSPGDLNAV